MSERPASQGVESRHWYPVPQIVATRMCGRRVRLEAEAEHAVVLDFSKTEFLSLTAADELVCNGQWDATTGESPEIRKLIVRALKRRGMLP